MSLTQNVSGLFFSVLKNMYLLLNHPSRLSQSPGLSCQCHTANSRGLSTVYVVAGFPCGSVGKESAHSAGDLGFIPGLRRSPGKGKGYPLQYSVLENPTDCIVHGAAESRTWPSDFHFTSLHMPSCCSLHPSHPLLPSPWGPQVCALGSASPLLPCKLVHQDHLSRFHTYKAVDFLKTLFRLSK